MEQIKVDFYDFHKNKFMPIIKEFYNAHGSKLRWQEKAEKLTTLRTRLENELIAAFPFEANHGVYLSIGEDFQLNVETPLWYRAKLQEMAARNYKPLVDGKFQNEDREGERHATTQV